MPAVAGSSPGQAADTEGAELARDNVQIAMGSRSVRARVDAMIVDRGLTGGPQALHRRCLMRVLALEAHSDVELARLGLSREDILFHVFREVMT
jgi:hypothetical protein